MLATGMARWKGAAGEEGGASPLPPFSLSSEEEEVAPTEEELEER